MLDVLTPEQRAKLKKMMGDAFALPDGGFGGRFRAASRGGAAADDGGRGGDRPRRESTADSGDESIDEHRWTHSRHLARRQSTSKQPACDARRPAYAGGISGYTPRSIMRADLLSEARRS